jgi:hypothetical protein
MYQTGADVHLQMFLLQRKLNHKVETVSSSDAAEVNNFVSFSAGSLAM